MENRTIETIDDIKQWIYEHRTRSEVLWEQQHVWDNKIEERMLRTEIRLTAIEKRVAVIAGIASVVGAILGSLASQII